MLQSVDVGERSLGAYRGVARGAILDELVELAGELRGVGVLHRAALRLLHIVGVRHACSPGGLQTRR